MTKTPCFEILMADKLPRALPPVVVAAGDDAFLRRHTLFHLLRLAQIQPDDAKSFDGEECQWRDVHDELATISLFDPEQRRVAIVKNGDAFVKEFRPRLEKWTGSPVEASLMLLEVSSFPSNTNLFKIVAEKGWCIDCAATKGKAWENWIQQWAARTHKLKLTANQAAMVSDLVGNDFGLVDQELAKTALYANDEGKIDDAKLKQAVGSWRTQTIWQIIAAAVEGRTSEALHELGKLILAGESPMAIVPQMSWSMRRYGTATHLIIQAERARRRLPLKDALARAGFRPFELGQAEKQLRRLGRHRGHRMLEWLLELDLKLKGSHSQEGRGVLAIEEFIVRLAGND